MAHIIIIGGGGSGSALAHDLTLRGFAVTLFERGAMLSGTTGRHHGLLHSGARYAVHDPEAARECIRENRILRRIAPQALEQNDGLFIALTAADVAYAERLREACRACDIPVRKLTAAQALAREPALAPGLKMALQVPDATIDAWRLPMHFLAQARAGGARIRSFCEVRGLPQGQGRVTGVEIFDYKTQRTETVAGDLVVNATGAWAGKITALAGIEVPVQPAPGIMVAVEQRFTRMVINRLHPADEGDIIVPQRRSSILGTSLWLANDPDDIELPQEQITRMVAQCSAMIPGLASATIRSAWCAARPLIRDTRAQDPQQISRTFACLDHRRRHGVGGLISLIGGKATTLRAMAEKAADLACRKLGRTAPCQTAHFPLTSYRQYYRRPT